MRIEKLIPEVERLGGVTITGKVTSVLGLLVECAGIENFVSVGSRCAVHTREKQEVFCEVVGFRQGKVLLMPFAGLEGIGPGCTIRVADEASAAHPDSSWLGRVVDAFGHPIDSKGALIQGPRSYPYRNTPPPPHRRRRVQGKIDLGVRALNTFLTTCRGQRLGIFSGSGVGKSILMSMIAKFSTAHVNVIGLIGERGREVQEFIEDYLGPEGMARSVIVVATSNESALMRRQAAYLTLSIAEYFRDEGKEVLCMMDSVTRFAMAQREIGLSTGEPPASKGYTPTVFAELPKLLERAGPGTTEQGNITGFFTVLVEGDDHNEPIADAVRGILDGHVVLDRAIAERGRFPAVNILRSVSRVMPDCNNDRENALITRARQLMATYDDMAEMIRLGAYKRGSDPAVDEAIHYYQPLERLLSQARNDSCTLEEGYKQLAAILGVEWQ